MDQATSCCAVSPTILFQSKVLQRLYPAAPKSEKEPSPPRTVEALAKPNYGKRKTSRQENTAAGDAGKTPSAANPGRRMYTVLPPPADYTTDSEKSVTLAQLESINSAEDPAVQSASGSDHEQEEAHKRKRKRKKKKQPLHQGSGNDGAAPESEGQSRTALDEGGERISRNKKRKLKKKRHKDKLLSMGLMPRAAALEFTYRKDVEEAEKEEEEEDNETRAAEVSDFLRTTIEIYKSDSSSHGDEPSLLSGTMDNLLSSIASGHRPTSVLEQLYSLKAFVQQKQTEKLEKALQELYNTSLMSAEETTAVVSLFQYWITDILPMQGDKKTGLSTTHP
ncbi:glutamate-rich protein 1 isoform X1 [Acanthopagrus latus]|uniref:glutamate-rich protein 1 isoform X1 n=1 Tax=Acanthopagrus latus TaxID=8177 RepID=UPI00187C5D0B|nr:glutamate-rich protein 1 isoform X1 [Acanthopagrus latus]